jgi:hypothetical protein
MAMTFSTNQSGANTDYMKYVGGQIVKTDKINSPDLLDFSLINFDGTMVRLSRGAHVVLTTNTYGVWFSGFITNDPEPVYIGTNRGVPQWGYTYQATGEEYLLNLKPFGIMAPFTNTTQGAIIKALINRLTPAGFTFDVSGIGDGQPVPRFIVDPNKHFSEIISSFAKAAHYQFRCKNFVATYLQQDAVAAGISVDGNNKHFTPSQLSMKASGDPIINDSIILGSIEPQNYMNEYFMGDGATAQFPLVSSVFGLDSTLLLTDDFSSSTIDTSKWTIYDTSAQYLQPFGGTLNVLGGSANGSLDVYLQSQSLVPLEGNLRCTHGEWDFISACDGVLGGLWTGQTSGSMAGLVFGIRALPSGAATLLHPIVGSSVDTTQTVNVSYTKRYVMRTEIKSGEAKRFTPVAAYRAKDGGIHQVTLPAATDHFYATTVISEIDPITAVMTNQWTWTNDLGVVSASAAYYVPVASNSLNLTVCSITISVPLQATLSVKPSGDASWSQTRIGPNEIDTLDGLAPAATIVDSNNGAQTRSSLLGSANYNPGQATLTYFKETAQLISYLPQPGDIVRLSYRGAGAAIGRAQSKASIAQEAAGWGDDGVRSETKSDLSPLPKTSQECELYAVARVNDNSYQHWTGTYTMPSGSWFSSEPLAGTILAFTNLPSQFPSNLQAESITQVSSTMVSQNPTEVFNHAISFGPLNAAEENILAAIKNTNDVFTPQDTAEIPQFIDVASLGNTTTPSVPEFLYTGQDSSNWHFQFQDALPSSIAGIEVRYTDNTWGADDGNNLVARLPRTTTTFSIPRTVRGKVAYMRCYDQRNIVMHSEDITQHASVGSGQTKSLVRSKGPDGSYQMISRLSTTVADSVFFASVVAQSTTPANATFSVSILGPTGSQITVGLVNASSSSTSQAVVCTGKWQRIYVTGGSDYYRPYLQPHSTGVSFQITRMSVELGTQETIYCKTNATAYGATSRFSKGVHTVLPLIPPPPTASGNFTKINAPVISVILPANLTDVWGCEIRAADNTTVLFNTALVNATLTPPTVSGDTSMVLQTVVPALSRRAYSYWVYTFNLFGEYSSGFQFTGTISPPTVTNLNIVNSEKMLVWTGSNATAYAVYIDKTDMTLQDLSVTADTINTYYPLSDVDFFNLRYIVVIPYDAIGQGNNEGGFFEYLPDSITSFTSTITSA